MKPEDFYEGSDYTRYIPSDIITLDEATALSLGMNPDITPEAEKHPHDRNPDLREIREKLVKRKKEINEKSQLFLRHTRVTLEQFYLWGREKNYEFDKAFIEHMESKIFQPNFEKLYHKKCEELEKEQNEKIQLNNEFIQLKDQLQAIKENPTATMRKLGTKNKIIGAFAKGAYKYEPGKSNGAMKGMLDALALAGVPFVENTLRRHLKEAFDLLPRDSDSD